MLMWCNCVYDDSMWVDRSSCSYGAIKQPLNIDMAPWTIKAKKEGQSIAKLPKPTNKSLLRFGYAYHIVIVRQMSQIKIIIALIDWLWNNIFIILKHVFFYEKKMFSIFEIKWTFLIVICCYFLITITFT